MVSKFGTNGNDTLSSSSPDSQIYYDLINGGEGNDRLFGGDLNDRLIGGRNNDALFGNAGNDTLAGGSGKDSLWGELGSDLLNGNNGNDSLDGGRGPGKDTVFGGAGNDTLVGSGLDILTGGAGADTFIFSFSSYLGGPSADVIKDFDRTQGDKIQILDGRPNPFGIIIGPNLFGPEYDMFRRAPFTIEQFSFSPTNGSLSFAGRRIAILENVNSDSFNLATDVILSGTPSPLNPILPLF